MALDEGIVNMRANDGVLDLHGSYASAHFAGADVPARLRLLAALTGAEPPP
jgi:hypothetical protein